MKGELEKLDPSVTLLSQPHWAIDRKKYKGKGRPKKEDYEYIGIDQCLKYESNGDGSGKLYI